MVAALPVAELTRILKINKKNMLKLTRLNQIWKPILKKFFNQNPRGYVPELMEAKNPGTLAVVKEIIHEDKIPLTL